MDALLNDLKAAARALTKQPGSALISVVILALGIGLSTSMFSLVYGVLFRNLDVPEAHRIGVLSRVDLRSGEPDDDPMLGHDLLDFREQARSFDGLLGYYGGTVNLADDQDPDGCTDCTGGGGPLNALAHLALFALIFAFVTRRRTA